MRVFWITIGIVLLSVADVRADHRFVIEPSLQVIEVADDNLYFSVDEPVRDRIRRVTPLLGLRYDNPRLSVAGSYGLDSEHFLKHSQLDDDRARERARLSIQYEAAPRLTLSLTGNYLNTNTLAELTTDTGLAASRSRGQYFTAGSWARLRVSPRLIATVQTSSLKTNVVNGSGMRSQMQALILERHVTGRDLFNFHYEHTHVEFDGATSQRANTQVFLGRWIHNFGLHNRVTVQAGPRLTDGKWSTDFTAIAAHTWKSSTIALSFLRTETTLVGYAGMVETRVLQSKLSFNPIRRLTAYATPAFYKTTNGPLQGTVYRFAAGGRYDVSPLLGADVAYTHERQNGAIDPTRPDGKFSRATMTIGFTTRWNNSERTR